MSKAFLVVLFGFFCDSWGYFRPASNRGVMKLSMALTPIKGGSIVALVTPMTITNDVDYEKLVELLEWHINQGTDGAVILGTTGEASTLSLEERTQVIKTTVSTVKGAFPIIVGTGTIDTQKSIELSLNAKANGADGILVITPYYVKPPQRALITHFNAIADAVALPTIVYNCPGRTGVTMSPETIGACSKNPYIIGVKDAIGTLVERIAPIRSLCKSDFLLYSGEDDMGCEYVSKGADGVISVTANVAPASMHRMLAAAKAGDSAVSEAINKELIPLHGGLFCESNPIPVKKALEFMGKIGPGIRPPLAPLDSTHYALIKAALATANVPYL